MKEKYKEIVCGFNDERTENVANRCVEIADQHAIDFTKWIINVSTSNTLKHLTIEELLVIYKKL